MKNLLTYINPEKSFTSPEEGWKGECDIIIKVAIDNSLELGWKKEDILLVTNFPYEYNGVTALVVGDENYCEFSPTASKVNVIIDLFNKKIIGKELYWFHDIDAFQLNTFTEEDVNLKEGCVGITGYGITRMRDPNFWRWSTGTLFFKDDTKQFFELLKQSVYKYKCNEEVALLALEKSNKEVLKMIHTVDITYNVATRRREIVRTYESAEQPVKVLHFHPFDKRMVENESDNMDVCVYGKNTINKVLIPDRLITIFKKYGIK